MQVRDRQCRTGSTAPAVQFKPRPLNGVCLILPPLPGDRLTFFVCSLQKKYAHHRPLSDRFPRAPPGLTAPHGCIHSVFPAGYPASVHHLFKIGRYSHP
ncbi:hypothetical protein SF274771_2248 [Shigella flexneri 2747-71]|nr:hypothetical protein SF274771_2248 [Shigella flexneri 2747-71]